MSQQNEFFAKALHDFTMNAAAGDAIKHLTDRGYTLSQIKEALTFPAPEEYIAKIMWERLLETHKVIIKDSARVLSGRAPVAQTVLGVSETSSRLRDSLCGIPADTHALGYEIVESRDRYGRKSFLRIQKESPEENAFSPEDYVQYENIWVITSVQEQVSSLSDHIPLKVRNTGSHRDT